MTNPEMETIYTRKGNGHRRNFAYSRRLKRWVRVRNKSFFFLYTHDVDIDSITLLPNRKGLR